MKTYWRRIQITEGVSAERIRVAKEAAINHPLGELVSLPFTEANEEWVLLYEHAQVGQITPHAMKHMRRKDLYYLAGMTFPHPALTEPYRETKGIRKIMYDDSPKRFERVTKLQGNAARAKNELQRRNFFWAGFVTVLAAFVGTYLGS